MATTLPERLFRYRSCDGDLLARELETLKGSYLYAPSFEDMNDPMEAFLEVGGYGDDFFLGLSPGSAPKLKDLYAQMTSIFEEAALISFSSTATDLPLWAYYAGNFRGLCLEFDPVELRYGSLRGEQLHPVTYAKDALPPVSLMTLFADEGDLASVLTSRLTRKRVEWAHEKEWRYIAADVGKKYLLDTALQRVYLGPLMPDQKKSLVCQLMANRPVEIMQGLIKGFDLSFEPIQAAAAWTDCARVGAGKFNPKDDLLNEERLRAFLKVPFEDLVNECRRLAQHPNMESFTGIDVSTFEPDTLFIALVYRLRNGSEMNRKLRYDNQLGRLPDG